MKELVWKFDEFLYEQLESDKYYIYTLADPIDGEIKYVGKSKDLKNRLSRHMSPYSLRDAWTSKNKWLSWLKNQGLTPVIEILDEGDINNIDDLEIYWIEQIKSWGYKLKNDTKGGRGCEYWTGKKLSDEHKMKIKMNNPLRRDICKYEIGTDRLVGEYVSSYEAERTTGVRQDHITDCCKNRINTAGGFYWRYKNDYFPFEKKIINKSDESKLKSKMNNPLRKDILQYRIDNGELVGEYSSSYEAEEKTKINRNHICMCCRGVKNYNSAGGFYWRYKDNDFPYKKSSNYPIKIQKLDKNMNLIKQYISYKEAEKDGFYHVGIKSSSNDKTLYKDYYWKIIEEKK